jgi:soluble lytic murein transglycosylase-like protein
MKVKMFLFMSTAVTLLMIMSFNTSSPTEVPTDEALPSTSSFNFTEKDPPCLRMYEAIEKYATMYRIPKRYAYGVANVETGYRGPFHWKYNQAQTSCVGALGPMQIMPGTAQMMWPNKDISRTRLKTDIEYNVHTSMKLLRKLYDKYEDWKVVFGCYNTGRPLVNGYAIEVYNFQPLF